jgi:hypothetical protein
LLHGGGSSFGNGRDHLGMTGQNRRAAEKAHNRAGLYDSRQVKQSAIVSHEEIYVME